MPHICLTHLEQVVDLARSVAQIGCLMREIGLYHAAEGGGQFTSEKRTFIWPHGRAARDPLQTLDIW
ncbi:hypothetical protein MAE02_57470 [Microvirga aerophila]|uniref:Uncharacterized protein n=1 Tax=Microvirga aerophila TaxID=670291 RepID=A0A512C1G1_9HYPH|nr:hypothetical protein MAE02_57470 [Microvirga aerophila]